MLRILAVLTLAAATTGWAQPAPSLSSEQNDVMRAENAYRLAKIKQDLKTLDEILADDFYEMNQNGNGRDKKETLDLWKRFSIQDLRTDDIDIKITGNVAVVRGNQTEWNAGVDVMMFMRVYLKTQKGWQLLSSLQAINPKLAPGLR
jgi:hypothetical protein